MSRFSDLNPEDQHRDFMAMEDDFSAHDQRLDRWERMGHGAMTAQDRAVLYGIGPIDKASEDSQ